MKNPLVSVIIPTLNEEKNIERCLSSIFNQSYPKESLEVIVVDDKSMDRTLEIVEKFPVKVLTSGAQHGEISKMIGFKAAKGEFAIYLDADVELIGKDWFEKMLKPLLEDEEIIGSFTRKYTKKSDPAIERFITFDPLQRDSLYQFFSTSIEEIIVDKKEGYYICQYKLDRIPPAGRCLYRRKKLMDLVSEYDMFLELDFLVLLVTKGFCKFAYVPNAGLYHHHAQNISELLRKRKYNLTKVYLGRQKRLYKWFDLTNPGDFLKVVCWIIYANLFFPGFIVGVYKVFKYKDWVGIYEPIVNLLVTDYILWTALTDRRIFSLFNFQKSKESRDL